MMLIVTDSDWLHPCWCRYRVWKSSVILKVKNQTKPGNDLLYFNANPHNIIEFLHDWLRTSVVSVGRLLLNVLSKANEDERCIEHRNDDSVLSCLSKTRIVLIFNKRFFHPRWDCDGDGSPFWATRKRFGPHTWMVYYAPAAIIFRLKRFTQKSTVSASHTNRRTVRLFD